jgi:hypothetical protein
MRALTLALALAVYAPAAHAATVKIPPLKLCMNNTSGAIVAKKKCTAFETALTGGALQALSSAGPQGPQGPQGPAGGFDWTKCTRRSVTNSGIDYKITSLNCNAGEFLMTHGVDTDNISSTDIISLSFDSSDRVATGVAYGTFNPFVTGAFNVITVSGVCCKP